MDIADMGLRCVKIVWRSVVAQKSLPRLLEALEGFQKAGYKKSYAVARFVDADSAVGSLRSGVFGDSDYVVTYLGDRDNVPGTSQGPSDLSTSQLGTPLKASAPPPPPSTRLTPGQILENKVEKRIACPPASPARSVLNNQPMSQPPRPPHHIEEKLQSYEPQGHVVQEEKEYMKEGWREGRVRQGCEHGGFPEGKASEEELNTVSERSDSDTNGEKCMESEISEQVDSEMDNNNEEDSDGGHNSDVGGSMLGKESDSVHEHGGDENHAGSESDTSEFETELNGRKPAAASEKPRGLSRSMLEDDNFVHRDVTVVLEKKVSELELYIRILEEQGAVREREREEFGQEIQRQRIELEKDILQEREAHEIETRSLQRQIQSMSAKIYELTDERNTLRRDKEAQAWSDAKDLQNFRRDRLANTYIGDVFGPALAVGHFPDSVGIAADYGFHHRHDQVRNLYALDKMTSKINRDLAQSSKVIDTLRKSLLRREIATKGQAALV